MQVRRACACVCAPVQPPFQPLRARQPRRAPSAGTTAGSADSTRRNCRILAAALEQAHLLQPSQGSEQRAVGGQEPAAGFICELPGQVVAMKFGRSAPCHHEGASTDGGFEGEERTRASVACWKIISRYMLILSSLSMRRGLKTPPYMNCDCRLRLATVCRLRLPTADCRLGLPLPTADRRLDLRRRRLDVNDRVRDVRIGLHQAILDDVRQPVGFVQRRAPAEPDVQIEERIVGEPRDRI